MGDESFLQGFGFVLCLEPSFFGWSSCFVSSALYTHDTLLDFYAIHVFISSLCYHHRECCPSLMNVHLIITKRLEVAEDLLGSGHCRCVLAFKLT